MDTNDKFHEPTIKEGYGVSCYPVRWQPYKPAHTKATGQLGRWQKMNEWGGWENCDRPLFIVQDPESLRLDRFETKPATDS